MRSVFFLRCTSRSGLWALLLLLLPQAALAQENRLIPVEDWTYTYLSRLQRRGHLLDLSPTALPYRQREITAALSTLNRAALSPTEAGWVEMLDRAFRVVPAHPDEFVFGVSLEAGMAVASHRRLDPLRPLDDPRPFPNASLLVYLEKERLIAHFGARHDLYYDQDPDGIDAANRIASRNENSYMGFAGDVFSAYLGRFSNHWGLPGETAVLVSANPRSYDQLNLRFGGKRFALRSLLGELDSITGDNRFTGTAGDDSVRTGSQRRFLSAHRFDWRPSRHLNLSLMEATVYSGPNTGLSLKYLNPLPTHIFQVDNPPKNDENNGLIAGLIWLYAAPVTFHGQLLVDDFDFVNASEPASFALAGTILLALPRPLIDVGASLEMVAARTYNAQQPEGRYLYLGRGLATQFSDYVLASVFADLYLDAFLPGLMLTPRLQALAQGERDIRRRYPGDDEVSTILNGTIERTLRLGVEARYQPYPWWWLRINIGPNRITNRAFVEGTSETVFTAQLDFGLRLSLNRAFGDF